MKTFFVCLMTNESRAVLYTGVTNDLARRALEHQRGEIPGFTKTYKVNRLMCYEAYKDPLEAIAGEKEIKGWLRSRKNALIETLNPKWADLSATLFEPARGPSLRSG